MWEEYNIFNNDEVRLFRAPHEHLLDFLRQDRYDCICVGKYDFNHPSPEPDVEEKEEEEETMRMYWKQTLQLLTRWDPLVRYSA